MATIQFLKTQLLAPKEAPPNNAVFVQEWENRAPRDAAIKKKREKVEKDNSANALINAPPPMAQSLITFEIPTKNQIFTDLDNADSYLKKGIEMLPPPGGKTKIIQAREVDEFTGKLITGETDVEIGNDTPEIKNPVHAPGFRIDVEKLRRSNMRAVTKKGAEQAQVPGNIYTQHELTTIAAALGIQRGGKKQDLVQRILEAI